jgi:hypothetical protein
MTRFYITANTCRCPVGFAAGRPLNSNVRRQMKAVRTITAVFFVVALTVLVPRLAWTVFDTYVLAHPDGKFGASGGIQFVAFFVGIAAAIAGAVGAVLVLIRRTTLYRAHLLSAFGAGLALSFASFWIPDLAVYGVGQSLFGEIGMIMVNWAVVCALVLVLAQLIVGGMLPPNSRFHAVARNTARAGEAER